MNIEFEKIAEYIQKSATLDTILNYVRTMDYVHKEDILAFVGEKAKEEAVKDD